MTDDDLIPTASASDDEMWLDGEPPLSAFVDDPSRPNQTLRTRRVRFVAWMAILGTIGLALASVVVR